MSNLLIEEGYNIGKINESLYENLNQSIKDIEFLHSKILEFWPSPDHFFNVGIGYCAPYKNEVVSICFLAL